MTIDSTDGVDDAELLERFKRRGDRGAFEAIAKRHLGLMRRTLQVALGGNRESAEDALQDSLIRLHRALPSFRSDSKLSTFIAGVCRHAAQDEARREAKEARKAARVFVLKHLPAREGEENDLDPATVTIRNDEAEAAIKALYILPEPDRSILYLKDAEGMEIADLTRIFSLPEGTVKSKLFRAREKVRRALEEAGYGV